MCSGETEQDKAYSKLRDFIDNSKEEVIVLQGQAGTGKTYLLRQIVSYLKTTTKEFVLCAPTHKAKFVLNKATGEDTVTLHTLLSLAPNIEIFKLDYSQLVFKASKKKSREVYFPCGGIIIIDESSMVTDAIYDLLLTRCREVGTRIIFVGDSAQIQGVNEGHISKVFSNPNTITLTHIYRQESDNALIPLFTELRENPHYNFAEVTSENGNLHIYDKAIHLALACAEEYKQAIFKEDVNYTKMIAYTNLRVQGYNECIRKLLWHDTNEYHLGEFVTGYENFNYLKANQFYNSVDYIIIDTPRLTTRTLPEFGKVQGYALVIYDTVYDTSLDLFMLPRDTPQKILQGLAYKLESIRFSALESNKIRAPFYWKRYFSLLNSFAVPYDIVFDNRVVKKKTLDYGYASTVHKVQGASLNSVYIDMKNILICKNLDELRQMQYVALSRTRSNVYMYQ